MNEIIIPNVAMVVNSMSGFLSILSPENIILFVFLGLALLWVFGAVGIISRQSTPSLMTSLGILGTFMGIFVALAPLDFGAEQINESIQKLLEGMETAFVTSLLGLASAIAFKCIHQVFLRLRHVWFGLRKSKSTEQDLAVQLDRIKQAISGEGDSSLVTQIQKMRDESRDGFAKLDGLSETIRDTLVKNLEGLAQEIRDIIGKQLGESLQSLIANIEKALIEQFGTTFVQFNEATQALKRWQEDHRQQVEQLTVAFAQTAQGVEKISAECARIPETMESLRRILEAANSQVADLTARLEAFSEMRRQAIDAFPEIKKNLDKIGDDLRSSAEAFNGLENVIQKTQKDAQESVEAIAQGYAENIEKMTSDMFKTMENSQKEVAANAERYAKQVEETANGMQETMINSQREVAAKIDGIIEAAMKKYANKVSAELDRIAIVWGENLVSIAERCAESIKAIDDHRNRGEGDS